MVSCPSVLWEQLAPVCWRVIARGARMGLRRWLLLSHKWVRDHIGAEAAPWPEGCSCCHTVQGAGRTSRWKHKTV